MPQGGLPYEQRGTQQSQGPVNQSIINLQKKQQCEASGGVWNDASQSCIMPSPQDKALLTGKVNVPQQQAPAQEGSTKPTGPEIFRNNKTGNPSGVSLPDGRDFLGLDEEEVAQLAAQQQPSALPAGTMPVGTAANEGARQQAIGKLMQLGQQGLLTPQEIQAVAGSGVDVSQAIGAGAVGAVPGLLGGLATGAVAGAIGGAATGAAAGAIFGPAALLTAGAGAVAGFLIAVRSNIRSQQTDSFAADREALTKGDRYLRSLITDTNQNPQNAGENIALFYQTLNMIDVAHAKTYKDSQEDLNNFLGKDGTRELARFEVFDSTMRQYYISQFNTALATPNPGAIIINSQDLETEFDGD